MDEMEDLLVDAKAKKRSILAEKVSGENIYKALIFFDKLYEKMSETERRQFYEKLLGEVNIYEERQPNGQWIKSIVFKLPIIEHDIELSLDNDDSVEGFVIPNWRAKSRYESSLDKYNSTIDNFFSKE